MVNLDNGGVKGADYITPIITVLVAWLNINLCPRVPEMTNKMLIFLAHHCRASYMNRHRSI